MKLRWGLYWAALVAALFGVLIIKNQKTHHDKTRHWQMSKSIIECILLVLAAAFMPAILVVYSSMYFTQWIKRPAFRIGAGFIIGTILMMTVGWALELLVLAGCFAINLISDDFLNFLDERRMKRGVATVLDGHAT
jgi:hypothetical protein